MTKVTTKSTTKLCPLCGNTDLALFTSLNKKACINHVPVFYFGWELDEGQQSVYANNRIKANMNEENTDVKES